MFNREFLKNLPPVTRNILLVNLLIFVFLLLAPGRTGSVLIDILGLHYPTSPGFHFWQPLTYMFVQKEFAHFFFNMFALLMFGYVIERSLGSRRFLVFYLVCGIGAALVQTGVFAIMLGQYDSILGPTDRTYIITEGWKALGRGLNFTDPAAAHYNLLVNTGTIGASGAVFGILLAFAMLFPNVRMYPFFLPVGIKAKWMVLAYGVIELLMGVGQVADNVAHFAHLGGMLFGFILIFWWRRQHKITRHY